MLSFPNAKINLGLNIVRKRADGFHDLETVFYPVTGLRDALETVHGNTGDGTLNFTHTGLEIAGDTAHNLCCKAYHLLKKDFPQLPAIQMHLHKVIPMGAGLGGGSADGAFALNMLNQQFGLGLSEQQLINYALILGSDCPFFIINKACYATGRGEKLEHSSVDLSAYQLVLINPGIHVPTGWAFSQIQPTTPTHHCKEIVQQPVETWRDTLTNDFEAPVMKAYPEMQAIKEQLYQQRAVYAAMTGTGSTVYGIFSKNDAPSFNFPSHYFIYRG
jgi:4-diphosphocytidyl-2-C-methyl-D-erythritol kinase